MKHMNVAELIEELKKHDQNAEVVLGITPYFYPIKNVQPTICVEDIEKDIMTTRIIIRADEVHKYD